MPTIDERIAHLKRSIKAQEDQRNWAVATNWEYGNEEVDQAIALHNQLIALYQSLLTQVDEHM